MNLNNKGFAITAVLYTLLILFSLTLISVVAGLNTRNKMLEKSIDKIERKYSWSCISKSELNNEENPDQEKIENINHLKTAPETGKYIFINGTTKCYTYLEKGTDLTAISIFTYTSEICNANKSDLSLDGYCVKIE